MNPARLTFLKREMKAYLGYFYCAHGMPYGDTDMGLLQWVDEHMVRYQHDWQRFYTYLCTAYDATPHTRRL